MPIRNWHRHNPRGISPWLRCRAFRQAPRTWRPIKPAAALWRPSPTSLCASIGSRRADDPAYYRLVRNYEVLPDLQPREGMAGWEFRSEVIWLTNCSIAVDLRVRGEFGPPALDQR